MNIVLYVVVSIFALIGAAVVMFVLLFYWKMRQKSRLIHREYETREDADWFGKTGLSEETERELPRYLRRELGESLFEDEDALKASDLRYLGAFDEVELRVHYWHMPYRGDDKVYAYVETSPSGETCTGWGNREPPNAGSL